MPSTPRFGSLPRLIRVAFSCVALLATGCGASFAPSNTPAQGNLGNIQGVVHGGSQIIGGSHIYVFAAGTGGYGGPGIAPSAANASVSVMNSVSGGTYPTTYDSTLNAYYVTSDSKGNFGVTGDYTCTVGTQVYLYALGGNPGTGSNNASAGLLEVLGQCPASGTLASQIPFVVINEASTIAAAYAFSGFASDATHVSSSGTTLAATGIANAFANAANLYAINGSSNGANAITPNGTFLVPQATINTLANILAACVNSSGSSATGCSTLFTNAKSAGSTGTTATDTATAAINIAHNPGANVAALYGSPTPTIPFSPTLSSQPNDFTLPLTMIATTPGLYQPYGLAVDGYGNSWVSGSCAISTTNLDTCLVEFSSTGTLLAGVVGYTLPSGFGATTVVVDPSNNIWAGGQSDTLVKYSNSGTVLATYTPTYVGTIAFDAAGDAWLPSGGTNVNEISNTGSSISPSGGYTYGYTVTKSIEDIGIDGSGNAWLVNSFTTSNTTSLVKVSPTGTNLSGSTGYPTTSLNGGGAQYPVLDASGNVWLVSQKNLLFEMSNTGSVLSGSGFTGGGLSTPISLAIDGAGNLWVGNQGPYSNGAGIYTDPSISEFSNTGAAISPSTAYAASLYSNAPYVCVPSVIAVDGSGNLWVINTQYNYKADNSPVTEIIGVAVPVITPIAGGLPSTLTSNGTSKLGSRP